MTQTNEPPLPKLPKLLDRIIRSKEKWIKDDEDKREEYNKIPTRY